MKLPHDVLHNKLNNALLPGLQNPAGDGLAAQTKRGFAENLRHQISMVAQSAREGSTESRRQSVAGAGVAADRGTDLPVSKQKLPADPEQSASERAERRQSHQSEQTQKDSSAARSANNQNADDSARGRDLADAAPGRVVDDGDVDRGSINSEGLSDQRLSHHSSDEQSSDNQSGNQSSANQSSANHSPGNNGVGSQDTETTGSDLVSADKALTDNQQTVVTAETTQTVDVQDPFSSALWRADAELLANAAVSGSAALSAPGGSDVTSSALVSTAAGSVSLQPAAGLLSSDSSAADVVTGAGLAVSGNTPGSNGLPLNGFIQNAEDTAALALLSSAPGALPGALKGSPGQSGLKDWLSLPSAATHTGVNHPANSAYSGAALAFSALASASATAPGNTSDKPGPDALLPADGSAADLAGGEFSLADKLLSQKPLAGGSLQYASMLSATAAPSAGAAETQLSSMLLSGLPTAQQGPAASLDTSVLSALTPAGNGSSSPATASGVATSVYNQDQRQLAAAEARAQVQQNRGVDTSLASTSALKLPGLDVAFGQAGWADRIGRQMLLQSAQGSSSAQIRLDPPELGSLTVKIQLVDQSAAVNFVSPHAMVRDALEQQAGRLQEMFREQGINLVDVSVSDQSAQSDTGAQQHSQGSATGSATWLAEEDASVAPLVRQSESLIDYYA